MYIKLWVIKTVYGELVSKYLEEKFGPKDRYTIEQVNEASKKVEKGEYK